MINQNIIILAQQDWSIPIGTNSRSLAREFAKNNKVLYINKPLDINSLLRNKTGGTIRARLGKLFRQALAPALAEPNVWVYTPGRLLLSANWLSSPQLFQTINQLNARRLAHSIYEAAQAVGFDSYYLLQDGLLFPGVELKRLLRPRRFIYNLRDYMLAVPYFRQHGPWAEAALMARADMVTANSAYLRDYAQPYNPHSYDIGQGCVLDNYQAVAGRPRPADLAKVPGPIIGYTGFLTAIRLDVDLLLAIARQRPEWSLVLIGPEDNVFKQSPLHGLPNVFFLGPKAPTELAAYVQHFDACINPQLVNEVTTGNYPLKIDEYLAMGRQVVATATPAMVMFADYVYLASGQSQWFAQLETALADQPPARQAAGIAFAKSHTWAASAHKLYQALAAVEAAHAAPAQPAVAA